MTILNFFFEPNVYIDNTQEYIINHNLLYSYIDQQKIMLDIPKVSTKKDVKYNSDIQYLIDTIYKWVGNFLIYPLFLLLFAIMSGKIVKKLISMLQSLFSLFAGKKANLKEEEDIMSSFFPGTNFVVEQPGNNLTKLSDIIGIEDIKDEVNDLISIIDNTENIDKAGIRKPKGIVLCGAPGVGKTLLAKAIAGETKVPFIQASGSSFITGIVGQGARNIRNLFKKARSLKSCIVFIDEIDSIGCSRSIQTGSEDVLTINQLLTELDGFNTKGKIFVIAATNRIDSLDPALIRPGRFDKIINIHMPSEQSRIKLFNHYLNKINPQIIDKSLIDIKKLARFCFNRSPAYIANIVNQAGLLAIRKDVKISQQIIEEIIITTILGPKRDIKINEREQWMTAYHEAGHALVSGILRNNINVESIIMQPRAFSLGCTIFSAGDIFSTNRISIINDISTALAGMASEEIFFGNSQTSSGAANDIELATKLAKDYVLKFGLSKKIGPIAHIQGNISLEHSEYKLANVDYEVGKIIKTCYNKTMSIILINIDIMNNIANQIIKKGTIYNKEFIQLMNRS